MAAGAGEHTMTGPVQLKVEILSNLSHLSLGTACIALVAHLHRPNAFKVLDDFKVRYIVVGFEKDRVRPLAQN